MAKSMKHVISASYGNDSMAMIQWAIESKIEDVTVVYCDTGGAEDFWFLRVEQGEELAQRAGFKTVRLSSMGMRELSRWKKGFPQHGMQFCTMFLKGLPFLEWIDEADKTRESIVLIGKRRCESPDRKDTPEFISASEYHWDRKVWHPLYMHSDEERDALLSRAGVEKLNHRSDECFPCVNANRGDLRRLPNKRVFDVEMIELEVGQPMFRAAKHGGAKGIQEVVKWAKYSPGQYKPGQDDLLDTGCGSPFGCGL